MLALKVHRVLYAEHHQYGQGSLNRYLTLTAPSLLNGAVDVVDNVLRDFEYVAPEAWIQSISDEKPKAEGSGDPVR